MDRRSFLVRAAAIGTAVALPFQRAARVVEEVNPKLALDAGSRLLPAGTRLIGYENGSQAGWIGWVEELQSGVGNTVGWLSEKGVFHTIEELRYQGYLP